MILIAAVDDNNGMMFNKRRQSKDRSLRERILLLAKGHKLWMNDYTYRQFLDEAVSITEKHTGSAPEAADGIAIEEICVDEDFLESAGSGEYCFVENVPAASYEEKMEKIILFRWNRKYPSDFQFDIELGTCGWKLAETKEFPGFSHEKITEEVYVRE